MSSPAPATPRTISITQSMGASSVAKGVEKMRQSSPPFSGGRWGEDSSPPRAIPQSARAPEPEDSRSPPGLTSRSAPTPTNPDPTPGKQNEQRGCLGGLALSGTPDSLRPIDTNISCSICPRAESPTAKIGRDNVARPDACGAAIPSAICIIADGVAASCVSPRSNAHGCARQLAVATQYLNHSLLVPARPQQPIGSSSNSGRVRPATTEEATEVVHAGRGFMAGHGSSRIDPRPRTSSAGPREKSRLSPPPDVRNIWRSSLPGGNGRGRDLATSGLSSRPLTSTRAESCAIASPSRGKGTPMPRSPRKPIVIASPAKAARGGIRGIAHSESAFRTEEPETAQGGLSPRKLCGATPRHRARPPPPAVGHGDFEAGVGLIGEVGYTISSTSVARGAAFQEDGHSCTKKGPHISELFVPSLPLVAVGENTLSAAPTAVSQLQLNRLR